MSTVSVLTEEVFCGENGMNSLEKHAERMFLKVVSKYSEYESFRS